MQLEDVTAEIRPRSDWEAVDLGLAMVRRDFWRCFAFWWLAVLVPTAVAGVLLWDSPIVWLLMFWWWKPAGGRMVLFEVSRRLFGARPAMKEVLLQVPKVWFRRFFNRFVWTRFSPWLPVTMAVVDLEGLAGKSYRQRCRQVTRRGESVMMWFYLLADAAAGWFGLGFLMVVWMFLPEGQDQAWRLSIETWNPDQPFDFPDLIVRTVVLCVMLAMSLTDVFVAGAGFGVYINNRTAIEGWDVELAFRRLGRRLAGVVSGLLVMGLACGQWAAGAGEPSEAKVVMEEVKSHPDFKVHTVTDRIPEAKGGGFWEWLAKWLDGLFGGMGVGSMGEMLRPLVLVSVIGVLAALIAWLIWKNRHWFAVAGVVGAEDKPARARVVMGMEVSADTLPDDVPGAAMALWREGKRQEAMGLLYRGAISKVMDVGGVAIEESDTEGDCLRRVHEAGGAAHPEYFAGVTGAWIGLAYAGKVPEDATVESLCRGWPFVEGGNG